MSMSPWVFGSRLRAPGGLGVPCETRGEPCLLVGGAGGSGGVVVGGDEVQQGPRIVEGCRAAVLARAWYALVTVSDWWYIGLRCIVFRDGPGGMVSLDSAGSMFVAVWC